MKFDYSKLKGKMVEKGYNQGTLGEKIGIAQTTLSLKLNNKLNFRQKEIYNIMKLLKLKEIEDYFFTT